MRYNINNKNWDALNNKNWDLNLKSNIQCFPRRYRQIFFLLFSPHRISQTNDQFDQLKLEKKHKKAVAREEEYAKVNVERTTLGVVSMLSYPLRARPILPRRSPRAPNRIWSAPVYFFFAHNFEAVIEGNKHESAGRLYSLKQHTREELNRLCVAVCT